MDKIIEMIMIKSKFLYFVICSMLFSCSTTGITYEVGDTYTGPCIVFIYDDIVGQIEARNSIKLENGLGRISKNLVNNRFMFVDDSSNEMEIISIGKQDTVSDNSSRYIFELSKGTSSSRCSKTDLNVILFFVGTKKDYLDWSSKFQDSFTYFDVVGIKWCEYYKAGL